MKILIFITAILLLNCNSKKENNTKMAEINTINAEKDLKPNNNVLQNGDLIFHTSRSNQSQAIQIATNSAYSHMGIIYKEGDAFYVYEAVQPVKMTPLKDWINRGEDKKYVVKRLSNSNTFLTKEGVEKLKKIGKQYLGKNYDLQFEWSDDKIYCSELVWKMYKEAFDIEIGKLQRFEDFDLSDKQVQDKVKERYGSKLPTKELVITPDRMFNSDLLTTVKEEIK